MHSADAEQVARRPTDLRGLLEGAHSRGIRRRSPPCRGQSHRDQQLNASCIRHGDKCAVPAQVGWRSPNSPGPWGFSSSTSSFSTSGPGCAREQTIRAHRHASRSREQRHRRLHALLLTRIRPRRGRYHRTAPLHEPSMTNEPGGKSPGLSSLSRRFAAVWRRSANRARKVRPVGQRERRRTRSSANRARARGVT